MAKTLFDKLWDRHCVGEDLDGADLIAIDRVLLHERTGGVALRSLSEAGLPPIDTARVFAVMDHVVSFRAGRGRDEARSPGGEAFITETRAMAQKQGIHLIDTDDKRQGIVHVVATELGIAHPGVSIACPDSHTCSLGALGAFAIGIGSSEAEHAIATGVMRIKKPGQMRVTIHGALRPGVTAKDLALTIIAAFGADGAKRRVVEFAGDAVSALDLESRLTLCNMAVEFSAYTALIAPDPQVYDYVRGKPYAPPRDQWERATAQWENLSTDREASFDEELVIDASDVRPMVSWGTSPEQTAAISDGAPDLRSVAPSKRRLAEKAMAYMGLTPGQKFQDLKIDGAFIGSCTNGRLSDLEAAARVLRGQKVAPGVRAVCVPGSRSVEREATARGLDKIFKAAGFEWGAPGCAMCFYAGGETFSEGARVASSTNRNFEGRQGPGVRTHLASPETVAASAISGHLASAEDIIQERKGRCDEEA